MFLRRLHWLLLIASLCTACPSDDGDERSRSSDMAVRDSTRSVPDSGSDEGQDMVADLGSDSADNGTTPDAANDSSNPDTEGDTGSEGDSDLPLGPDNPSVGCYAHSDCPAVGDDPGVCCSAALRYESVCSTESACGPGGRDACVVDEQCPPRRPGSWTVCCHDRFDRNYCAPSRETCQPLVPCESTTDCVGNGTEVCCSYSEFYQRDYCTSEFLASDPSTDCP